MKRGKPRRRPWESNIATELTNNICNNQDMRKANGPATNIPAFKIKKLYKRLCNRSYPESLQFNIVITEEKNYFCAKSQSKLSKKNVLARAFLG